jgi:hypothetical protein
MPGKLQKNRENARSFVYTERVGGSSPSPPTNAGKPDGQYASGSKGPCRA